MSSCQNLAVDVGFGIGLIPFPGLLYFFGWYRYRKNLGTGLGQSSTKKVWKSVSKKIWYRKKYQNRSRRKFGAEKSLGENLVPKRVSEPVPFRFLGLLKSLPLDTSKMSTPGVIGNDNPSQATQCLAFIQTVVNQEIGFNSQLTSGSFSCSFDNNGKRTKSTSRTPRKVKHKLPSTRKRNAKRRQKILENKKCRPSSVNCRDFYHILLIVNNLIMWSQLI